MLKKIIACLLIILSLLSFTACTPETSPVQGFAATEMPKPTETPAETPTPTTYPETATIAVADLKDYTIVYPAEYTELRMDIVNELKAVIDTVTGGDVKIASNAGDVNGKKIILGSAVNMHSFKTEIDNFDDAMDYIMAVDGENIVLGGKNYYADMRAVYDFMENNLGYTSIGNVYSDELCAIKGVNFTYYNEPEFDIIAMSWSTIYPKEEYIEDIALCNYTMFVTYIYLCPSGLEAHNMTKWAAKYNLQMMSYVNQRGNMLPYSELFGDCPMFYGCYIWDEPKFEQMTLVQEWVDEFVDTYTSKYGWKPFVNYSTNFMPDTPYFMDCEAVAYDWYQFVCYSYDQDGSREGELSLKWLNEFKEFANANGKEMWTYIQAYTRLNGKLNASKAYRWQMYMDLCFGTEGIIYYSYMDPTPGSASFAVVGSTILDNDYNKTERYDYAKDSNAEILKAYDILKEYDNAGAYVINKKKIYFSENDNIKDLYGEFEEYKTFGVIKDLKAPVAEDGRPTMYLVGCYDKYKSNEKAFILINLEKMNDIEYGKDAESIARVKINGNNPKFYFEGEEVQVEQDSEGYYLLNIPNGNAWIVTVE